MLYSKFIYHAKALTIKQHDNNIWYLEPEWKDIICREIESDLAKVEESYLSDWWDVEEILKLEVESRNARDSKKPQVIDWIYETITAQFDPAMMQEEADFLKNFIEYKKATEDNIVPFPRA